MPTRREMMIAAGLYAAVPGLAITNAACSTRNRYSYEAKTLRRPLIKSADQSALSRELVRCATLAANSHNTQPWKFLLSAESISIRPDLSRLTPVVDPNEHHLWVSLGCAAENLVIVAAALAKRADVTFGGQGVLVNLSDAVPVDSPLIDAIFHRQCTRGDYDAQPLPNDVLQKMVQAAHRDTVHLLLLTDRNKLEGVVDYVTQANSAQIENKAFVGELKKWMRFNESDALLADDGLFTRLTGNPTLPGWLGNMLFSWLLSEKSENEKIARQLRSSAGVAVFTGLRSDRANWFEVGRAYQRFALVAAELGVRTAFVNQPVEVATVRGQFAQWLGLGLQRPDLVVRFGHGPQMPYSMRRPVADVIL